MCGLVVGGSCPDHLPIGILQNLMELLAPCVDPDQLPMLHHEYLQYSFANQWWKYQCLRALVVFVNGASLPDCCVSASPDGTLCTAI